MSEMFMFSLENHPIEFMSADKYQKWEIRLCVRTIDGVADVNILGWFCQNLPDKPPIR